MSGLAKLQDLMVKIAFLKQNTSTIPAQWERTWEGSQKILSAIKDQTKIARDIFKDMSLDITEIPRLDEVLEKIAQICQDFQDLYQKNDPAFQSLLKMVDLSSKLVTQINFVYDVDTSMFGDHVWDVKKDKFFYGDFEIISNFIGNMYDFYSMSPESSSRAISPLEKHLLALRSAGGQILDEFLPGVVYRKIPELVEEIRQIGKMIANIIMPYQRAIEHNFLQRKSKMPASAYQN